MPDELYKTHDCQEDVIATYTFEEWEQLPFVGLNDYEEDGDQRLELRLCTCGSSIGVVLPEPT
jgi:hypothetical protein